MYNLARYCAAYKDRYTSSLLSDEQQPCHFIAKFMDFNNGGGAVSNDKRFILLICSAI